MNWTVDFTDSCDSDETCTVLFFSTVMYNQGVLFHNLTVSWRTFKSTEQIKKPLFSINLINKVHMFLKYFSAYSIGSNVNMLQT